MSRYVTQFLLLGLSMCLLGWQGCTRGRGLVTVEGTVTFDGQPIEKGSIVFEPADRKGPTAGGSIENGKYQLANSVMPGKKIVRIIGVRKTGRQIEEGPPSPPGTMVDEIESFIPEVYNAKSTLTCEVTPGKANTLNFDLKPAQGEKSQ